MASAALPTPVSAAVGGGGGGGSHSTSGGRKTSARQQTLRRPTSRAAYLTRSESVPLDASNNPAAAAAKASSQPQSFAHGKHHQLALNDSSDDEMPVPMKLSALTKALLNDGQASEVSTSTNSGRDARNGFVAGARPSRMQPPRPPSASPLRPASRLASRRDAPAAAETSAASASSAAALSSSIVVGDDRDEGNSFVRGGHNLRESVRLREGASTRQHVRAKSTHLPSSRASSPIEGGRTGDESHVSIGQVLSDNSNGPSTSPAAAAPRKRVVRLSGTPGMNNPLRRSLTSSNQRKRPGSRNEERSAIPEQVVPAQQSQGQQGQREPQHLDQQPNADPLVDLNTPVIPIRTVRIAVGSSGNRASGRSGGSSSYMSSSAGAQSAKLSGGQSDQENMPEDPATIGRSQMPAGGPASSMRVKRVVRPGSFLSGPARRGGIRRQSEEEAAPRVGGEDGKDDDQINGRHSDYREERHENNNLVDLGSDQPQAASPFHTADNQARDPESSAYRESAARSGSPVSSRDSARANALRRQVSNANISGAHHHARSQSQSAKPQEQQKQPPAQAQLEMRNGELVYKIPPPPPQLPSTQDKENEAPPTFKRGKQPLGSSILAVDPKELKPAVRPIHSSIDLGKPSTIPAPPVIPIFAQQPPLASSPERKALASKSHNTPRRVAPPPPPKMSVVETATAAAGGQAAGTKKRQVLLRVNGRTYTRIDCIGRGGSSKVYRVAAESSKMLALKRVSLENADEHTVKGFKGEIDLLKRLDGVDRVIQLIDHELNLEKHMLSVVMEVGELDFNAFLRTRQGSTPSSTGTGFPASRLDPVFVRFYWKEMLECVAAVHARDVVHSDLKPANFVLVQGRLKLIDFGIANAIQTDMTVNVHRETQIGTPNYMSPESLMDSNQYAFTAAHNGRFCVPAPLQHQHRGQPKIMKLGKPSDVWSLGCILYQMVYGLPPFGRIANQMARCQAIINWGHAVEFPEWVEDPEPEAPGRRIRVPPSVIRTMRRCLNREQRERPTCEELLAPTDPFLYPREWDVEALGVGCDAADGEDKVLPMSEELLGRIIQSVVQRCRERLPSDGEAMSSWPSAYWATVRKTVGVVGDEQQQHQHQYQQLAQSFTSSGTSAGGR